MSRYTTEYLANNVLVGLRGEDVAQGWNAGNAAVTQGTGKKSETIVPVWWAGAESSRIRSDGKPNHYAGGIPVADVQNLLMGWEPLALPVSVTMPDGTLTTFPERVAYIRPDTGDLMGIHGEGYVAHGYAETLIRALSSIVGDTLVVSSAMLLKGGAVGSVQVQAPDVSEAGDTGVTFRSYITATDSLDGSHAVTYGKGVIQSVCDNTHAAAMGEASRSGQVARFRHTRNSLSRITSAREALGILSAVTDDFSAQVEVLCATTVTPAQWDAFLADVLGTPQDGESKNAATIRDRDRDALSLLWNRDARVSPWAGTAWGVVQAVSVHEQWNRSVRGGGTSEDGRVATRALRQAEQRVKGESSDGETIATLRRIGVLATV